MSIRIVQEKLRAAGFDPGELDGRWGADIEAALDKAQVAAMDSGKTVHSPGIGARGRRSA